MGIVDHRGKSDLGEDAPHERCPLVGIWAALGRIRGNRPTARESFLWETKGK